MRAHSKSRPLAVAALVAIGLAGCGAGSSPSDPDSSADDELRKRRCGDGACRPGETCSSCPVDCGACPIEPSQPDAGAVTGPDAGDTAPDASEPPAPDAGTSYAWRGSTSLSDFPKTGPVTTCIGGGTSCIVDIDTGAHGTPAESFDYALAQLQSHDRVLVRNDSDVTVMLTHQLTRSTAWPSRKEIFAYGAQRIRLDASAMGDGYTLRIGFEGPRPSNWEHWKGFELVGNSWTIGSPLYIGDGSSNVKIEDFWIHDNPLAGTPISTCGAVDLIVQDSAIWNNRIGSGTNAPDGIGLACQTQRAHLVRNFVAHAGDDAFDLWNSTDSEIVDSAAVNSGLLLDEMTNNGGGNGNGFKLGGANVYTNTHNRVTGSISVNSWECGVNDNTQAGPLSAVHNTLVRAIAPYWGAGVCMSSASTVTDNVSWDNIRPASVGDAVALRNSWQLGDADPQFVDAANGDFYLRPTSPYVASGAGGETIGASSIALDLLKTHWAKRRLGL